MFCLWTIQNLVWAFLERRAHSHSVYVLGWRWPREVSLAVANLEALIKCVWERWYDLQHSVFLLLLIYYWLAFSLFVVIQQERTPINGNQKETLKSFFKDGMTRVGSDLIPRAASATGLDTTVIEVSFTYCKCHTNKQLVKWIYHSAALLV